MDIKLSDGKGRFYQLTRNKQPASIKPSDAPVINNISDAQRFLKSLKTTSPTFWREIWKQVTPQSLNTSDGALSDMQIIDKLSQMLSARQLFIFPYQNNIPKPSLNNEKPKVAVGNNKGAVGSGIAAALGSALADKSAADAPPPPAKDGPSDKNAVETASPGKVSDDATTGATCNSQTETRGCPISMVSGEEVLPLSDFTLPGPLPFVWKRFYRTGHSIDAGLGHGWTHTASERLYIDKNQVTLFDDEGRQLSFARPDLYQRSKLINEGLNLDYIGKDCFILRPDGPNGTIGDKVFTRIGGSHSNNSHFRLSQIRHPAYRPSHNDLQGNRDPEQGFCIDLHYDADNQLVQLKGNWGKSLRLKRNPQGRIASVILINEQDDTQLTVAEYDYDDQADLVAQRNAAGVGETYQYSHHIITRRTLIGGFSYYYEWDQPAEQLNNKARCLRNWGDDGIYNYHFKWDPESNTSYATDSRGFTTTFVYNEFGQIVKEIDPEGGVHQYRYERGRKTGYIDPQGHSSTFYFNKENQPSGFQDNLGNRQVLSYFNGNPTEFRDKDGAHWKSEYTRQGQVKLITDPYGRQTHYYYHKNGLISQVTNPQGHATRYKWNNQGELIQVTDYDGNQQQLFYNSLGQVIERHVLLNLQAENNLAPSITHYSYTATGQLEKVTAPNGNIRSYRYNDNNQLIQYSDPQGRVTYFEYDGLSQITKRIDANGHSLHYLYDKERNLLRLTNQNGDDYRFEYDGCERLIKETGFDGRIQKYTYNKAGQLIQHQDADSVITEFERDANGQMVTKTSRSAHPSSIDNAQAEERSRYQYDAKGRLLETYNAHHYLSFEYDPLGNLEKEHHSDINEKNQRISASNVDIGYGNIWPGLRSQINLNGQRIDYLYSQDQRQQLEKIQLNGETITHIKRDALGREVERTQGQTTTFSEYDPMGRLQKQQAFNQNNKQQTINRDYAYDNFGNLSQLVDGNNQTKYVYDLLSRLKKTEGIEDETFDFDPAGNILGINETRTKDSPSKVKGNRLTLQGDRKFSYDSRGNLIKEVRGKGGKLETLFEYNLQNQLIKVIKNGQATEYKYDSIGRRIEKQDAFGITKYLWAEDQMVQESRNNIQKTYVYEPQSFKPVALIQDDEVYHYHLDHLGTPRELTNDAGEIVWKVRYKTYGNVALKECEEIENNLRFQGQYFDEESGLHYNRHRYYNPGTGQFINQDPIGLLGGVNNYRYVPNPTGWVDPFGLSCSEYNPEEMSPFTKNMTMDGEKLDLDNQDNFVYPIEIGFGAYSQTKNYGCGVPDNSAVSDIVAFRGDSRSPAEIFSEGFMPYGTNECIDTYVSKNIASNFVGTSKSPMSANRFAADGANKNIDEGNGTLGYLYTVRVNKGTDVNIKLGHNQSHKVEHEVITSSEGIAAENIMGAQAVDRSGMPVGGFIKNPGFKKP
ncbi:Rhs-family protein [hydrothermal vent metagenome]|uniref:Rhs-family protein n=1 Tax=hydrothermal vent metagenome TaxID=652676 RepID=A0A3B0Y3M6_9ZZZZ